MSAVNTHQRRRSSLCVPAGDGRKLAKALESGADEVVIDLEDAVAYDNKESARDALVAFEWPSTGGPAVAVRVNEPGSLWCHRDLELVAGLDMVTSVVVPKVESRADLWFVERLLAGMEAEMRREQPLGVQALVETSGGVLALGGIVSERCRLTSVIVGYADLAASLGRARTAPSGCWAGVRDAIVLNARRAGIMAIDGPFLEVADDERFRDEVGHAAEVGFDGKWVIHPRQVDTVNSAFTPAEQEVEHARRVLAALKAAAGENRGAALVDGALVDEAMARDARQVLTKVVS